MGVSLSNSQNASPKNIEQSGKGIAIWRDTMFRAKKRVSDMPKVVSPQELDQIVDQIAQYPDGIGIEGLAQVFGASLPRRTLQRRLATLIEQKRIVSEGVGRGLRYRYE